MPTNRICLVTGANSGIGKVTVLELAKKGFDVIMLCRNLEKARPVRQEIKAASGPGVTVDLIRCDLADFDSVEQAAREVIDRYQKIDVLVNNAGLYVDGESYTPDGVELTFATNHLGPFLLTNLLLPLLRKGQNARIVNVSSDAHRFAINFRLNELPRPSSYSGMWAYGASKLCNILFTKELAERLLDDGITANAVHPGGVNTNFGGGDVKSVTGYIFKLLKPFFRSPEKGAETSIYVASSPEVEGVTGLYFADCNAKTPNADARNAFYAKKLWEMSERMTQLHKRLQPA